MAPAAVHPPTPATPQQVDAVLAAARRDAEDDRRHVALTLTDEGRQLVQSVIEHRRSAIERVLAGMPDTLRDGLAGDLQAFAAAAGEVPDAPGWTLG